MESPEKFNKNLNIITEQIKTSAIGKQVNLIAVTKNQSKEAWLRLLETNIRYIGENRIQETIKKINNFPQINQFHLHLIGHLQTNKIKKAVKIYDVIQTVDSIKLAKKINKEAEKIKKTQEIYIQINITKDENKAGMAEENIFNNIKEIISLKSIKLTGIMTILKKGLKKKEIILYYQKIKEIQQKISIKLCPSCIYTSMGMTNDYKEAIEAGATHIRIGTGLFGQRK